MARSKKYRDLLIESLKDPKEALAYLNAIAQETRDDSEESKKLLLMALKDIVEAQGGMTQLYKKTGLGRESLYKTLSPNGNPRFNTLTSVIHAMGFDFKFWFLSVDFLLFIARCVKETQKDYLRLFCS